MNEESAINFLADQWQRSGVNPGDTLLVHSSLKRVLKKATAETGVNITPNTVYQSLLASLGTKGTLILPLFNFEFPEKKFFDILNTPSQMGALTEIGRLAPGAIRTGHPIYSFAVIGKNAEAFNGLDNYSGYGSNSPFAKLQELNGKIAVIDLTDQNSMTSYHFVEEQNKVLYRYFKEFPGIYVDANGEESKKKYALFVRDLEKGVKTDVNRMMDYLWENGFYKGSRPGEGYGMRTIRMEDLYRETEKIIHEGKALDYLYSIEKR